MRWPKRALRWKASSAELLPKDRDENGPAYNLTDWVRHHDRYEAGGHVTLSGRYIPPAPGKES
jgi:hypothetical protein